MSRNQQKYMQFLGNKTVVAFDEGLFKTGAYGPWPLENAQEPEKPTDGAKNANPVPHPVSEEGASEPASYPAKGRRGRKAAAEPVPPQE